MRKFIAAGALVLSFVPMFMGTVKANEPSQAQSSAAARYDKKDLNGIWYVAFEEGGSKAMTLLALNADGTAVDYLILIDNDRTQKIIQRSTWSYDPEHNMFEQVVTEVSEKNGDSPATVSHPNEVVRGTISLVKLGDEVVGIKFKKSDGDTMGYRRGTQVLLDAIERGR